MKGVFDLTALVLCLVNFSLPARADDREAAIATFLAQTLHDKKGEPHRATSEETAKQVVREYLAAQKLADDAAEKAQVAALEKLGHVQIATLNKYQPWLRVVRENHSDSPIGKKAGALLVRIESARLMPELVQDPENVPFPLDVVEDAGREFAEIVDHRRACPTAAKLKSWAEIFAKRAPLIAEQRTAAREAEKDAKERLAAIAAAAKARLAALEKAKREMIEWEQGLEAKVAAEISDKFHVEGWGKNKEGNSQWMTFREPHKLLVSDIARYLIVADRETRDKARVYLEIVTADGIAALAYRAGYGARLGEGQRIRIGEKPGPLVDDTSLARAGRLADEFRLTRSRLKQDIAWSEREDDEAKKKEYGQSGSALTRLRESAKTLEACDAADVKLARAKELVTLCGAALDEGHRAYGEVRTGKSFDPKTITRAHAAYARARAHATELEIHR